MALTPTKVYALLKKYTDDSIAGGGISAGKNCTIESIEAITGGNRVTFQWTLDNGTVKTDTMDVMDGEDGADGADGHDGAPGADGLTPSIAITEITGGHRVTVTIGASSDYFDVLDGEQGEQGPAGADGAPGVGVPTGGTQGQVLKKKSGTNYDTEWADESGGGSEHGIPSGGTENQILAKNSDDNYDVHWVDPETSTQVQSDWSQSDSGAVDYIKNKPENLVQDDDYNHTDYNYDSTAKSIVEGVPNALDLKVDKNGTDSLMTANEHTKLSGIETNAQVNVLECVQVNGTDLTITDKKVNINISTKADKVAGATNGNFAVLDSTGNLVDGNVSPSSYYLKANTYSKTEVDNIISALKSGAFEVVEELPTTDISTSTIYLVPKEVGTSVSNIYEEWICLDTTTTPATWELIGDTQIDLSNYVQKKSTVGLLKNDGSVDTTTYLTSSDITGKANKSEMAVSKSGDKTTITLKTGTSAEVLNAHQDISGKQNTIEISGKKVII